MRGIIGTLIFGMAMSIGVAHAQVAVPTLSPVPSFTIVGPSSNPAAQQWGAPSRVVVGIVNGSAEIDDGTDVIDFDATGTTVGGRLVGESFAIGGEVISLDVTGDFMGIDIDIAISTAEFAISGLIGDFLALGVGIQTQQQTFEAAGFEDNTTTQSMPVFGGSLKIGDTIFLGGAIGTETLEFKDALNSTNDFDGDRQVVRYGAGFRSGEGAFRAEYYVDLREPISVTIGGVDVDIQESVMTVASVEVVFSNILLGYTLYNAELDDGGDVNETSATTISVGWVPMEGLTIAASQYNEEETNTSSTPEEVNKISLTTVVVGWMF